MTWTRCTSSTRACDDNATSAPNAAWLPAEKSVATTILRYAFTSVLPPIASQVACHDNAQESCTEFPTCANHRRPRFPSPAIPLETARYRPRFPWHDTCWALRTEGVT